MSTNYIPSDEYDGEGKCEHPISMRFRKSTIEKLDKIAKKHSMKRTEVITEWIHKAYELEFGGQRRNRGRSRNESKRDK